MSNISSIEKLRRGTICMITFTLSIVVFTLSSIYYRNGNLKLSFVLFPQMAVYIILGFFHTLNVWNLENVISKEKKSIFMLVCYFFVYSAWYNIVLLPESGLGYIEWAIVLLVLTSNLVTELTSKKINNPFMGQRPMVLVYFGIFLFFLKMFFFYLFKDNIYDQFFLNNKMARGFVVFFSGGGLVLLLIQFFKHISNKFEVKIDKSKIKNNGISFVKSIIELLKKGITILLGVVSLPVLIIILTSGGLIVLLVAFITMNSIYNSILAFVEPILEKIASTGENTIHPSTLYYTLQVISMALVLIYTIWVEKRMESEINKKIEQRIQKEIRSSYQDGNVELFGKAKEDLLTSNFDTQLRILGSRSIVKDIVNLHENEQEK